MICIVSTELGYAAPADIVLEPPLTNCTPGEEEEKREFV